MSSVSIDPNNNMIIADSEENWQTIVKANPEFKLLKGKAWPYYDDWCEIFGRDRAIEDSARDHAQTKEDCGNTKDVEDFIDEYDNEADEEYAKIVAATKAHTIKEESDGKKRKKSITPKKLECGSLLEEAKSTLSFIKKRM